MSNAFHEPFCCRKNSVWKSKVKFLNAGLLQWQLEVDAVCQVEGLDLPGGFMFVITKYVSRLDVLFYSSDNIYSFSFYMMHTFHLGCVLKVYLGGAIV